MKRHDSGTTLQASNSPAEQKIEAAKQAEPKIVAARLGRLTSTKVHELHLALLAIVYVRQSTMHQMIEHRESLARQSALADHALALGWASDPILPADEHLGRT